MAKPPLKFHVAMNKFGKIRDEYADNVMDVVHKTSSDIAISMKTHSAVDTGTQRGAIQFWPLVEPSDGKTVFVYEIGPNMDHRTPDGRYLRSPIYQEFGPSGAGQEGSPSGTGFVWKFTPFVIPAVMEHEDRFFSQMRKMTSR